MSLGSTLKERHKKKLTKKIFGWAVALIPALLVIICLVALLNIVELFAKWLDTFFGGPTDAEVLYSWAAKNMADDNDMGLSDIENLPYDVSAIEACFKYEVACTDSNVYTIKLTDSDDTTYSVEYNLKSITSNYALPWQLMLSICTVNQYGDVDEFLSERADVIEDESNDSSYFFKYVVQEADIHTVYNHMATEMSYLTNYSLYGLAEDDSDGIYGTLDSGPTYEDYDNNYITDDNDSEGKYACIYSEDEYGVGIYYPVAALKTIKTWLYEYDFDYDITLDEEGRPIAYKLASVTKTTRIGGDDGLISDLKALGVKGNDMFEILSYILEQMPYAADLGISNEMTDAMNYYNKYGKERTEQIVNFDSDLAFVTVDAALFYSDDLDNILNKYRDEHDSSDLSYTEDDGMTVTMGNLWSRTELVDFATEFVGGLYYMSPYDRGSGMVLGQLSGNYFPTLYNFSSYYPAIGNMIEDAETVQNVPGYVTGMVFGISDWDFVQMVYGESLYLDLSGLMCSYAPSKVGTKYLSDWLNYLEYANNPNFSTEEAMYYSAQSLYTFTKWQHKEGKEDCVKFIQYDEDYGISDTTDIGKQLLYGDIGLYVDEDGNVTDIGIYVGGVNGYPSFVHCSASSSSYSVNYQGRVQISYLECACNGASHPDGGTVDYNCFIRIYEGNYTLSDSNKVAYFTDTARWEKFMSKVNDSGESVDDIMNYINSCSPDRTGISSLGDLMK